MLDTVRLADTGDDARHVFLDQVLDLERQRTRIALQDHVTRHHVDGAVGNELGERNHRVIHRIHAARDQGLHRGDDFGADQQRVAPHVRHRGVMTETANADFEIVFGGHDRALAHGEFAGFDRRKVMNRVNRLDRKTLEQAVVDHRPRTRAVLLGGLEDEYRAAVEIALFREISRGAEQHRGMPVVAAGVHLAVVHGAVIEFVPLVNQQRIHVGAQPERAPALSLAQYADDAGFTDFGVHLEPEIAQQACHLVGGALFLEGEFRVAVDVMAPVPHRLAVFFGYGHLTIHSPRLSAIPGQASLRRPDQCPDASKIPPIRAKGQWNTTVASPPVTG